MPVGAFPPNDTYSKEEANSRYGPFYDVMTYGAVGDGVANDTAAVLAASTAWLANRTVVTQDNPGTLVFRPGKIYKMDPITIVPRAGATGVTGGIIQMTGARIVSTDPTTPAITVSTYGSGVVWQDLSIIGGHIEGRGIRVRAGSTSEYIWNVTIDRPRVTKSKGACIQLDGVFESQIVAPFLEMEVSASFTPASASDSCIFLQKESGKAQPSSIDIYAPTTRGGWNGINSVNSADVKVYGGTCLAALKEAISLQGVGMKIDGTHAENNWLSGITTGAAAFKIVGKGAVRDVFSIADTAASMAPYTGTTGQRHAVNMYVLDVDTAGAITAGISTVDTVTHRSNVSSATDVYVAGGQAGGSVVNLAGIKTYTGAIVGGKVNFIGGAIADDVARTAQITSTNGVAVLGAANRGYYMRLEGRRPGATGIVVNIGTSSGNISAAIFGNNGSKGTAARPAGAIKAQTGSIASPGTGFRTITFAAAVDIEEGDWLYLWADNNTVTFLNCGMGAAGRGKVYIKDTATAAPATASFDTEGFNHYWASTD